MTAPFGAPIPDDLRGDEAWAAQFTIADARALIERRVRCECCGDWGCAEHGGHIGERCDCWPCDDCGELFPPEKLSEPYGLCSGCEA